MVRSTLVTILFTGAFVSSFFLTRPHPAEPPSDPRPVPVVESTEPSPPPITLADVEREMQSHAPPAIDALFWGQVRRADGEGLGGSTVRVWPDVPAFSHDRLMPTLEEAIQRRWRRDRWRRLYERTATTDEDGYFELGDLVAADYQVDLGDGRSFIRLDGDEPLVPGSWIELVGIPPDQRQVVVKVRSADEFWGEPPIYVVPVDASHRQLLLELPGARSGRDKGRSMVILRGGEIRVPLRPGTELWTGNYRTKRYSPRTTWQGKREVVELVVAEEAFIEVIVHYPPGMEESVVWIGFMGIEPDSPLSRATFARAAQWQLTAGGSTFHIAQGAPPGSYQVGVALGKPRITWFGRGPSAPSSGESVDATAMVELGSGKTLLHMDIAPLDLTNGIAVEVRDDIREVDDKPHIGLFYYVDGKRKAAYARETSLADGRTFFYGYGAEIRERLDGTIDGRVVVAGFLAKHRAQGVVRAGAPATAVVHFQPPGQAEIQVEGLASYADRPGLGLTLRGDLGSARSPQWRGDVALFEDLSPGEYQLEMHVSFSRLGGGMKLEERSVTVRPGATAPTTVPLEELHRVRYVPPPGDRRGGLRLHHEDGRSGWVSMIRGPMDMMLPSGAYHLEGGEISVRFTVPGRTEVDLSGGGKDGDR